MERSECQDFQGLTKLRESLTSRLATNSRPRKSRHSIARYPPFAGTAIMSAKTMSPTAKLLRNSRLFSVPPPLEKPGDLVQRMSLRRAGRDTETTPHPVQQAITTPSPSLSKGDWGLKRSLPLKSTARTSTPLVRINALDTYEHITDFESASDLTITLQKIQDLAIPIIFERPQIRSTERSSEPARSVFEDSSDNTDPAVENGGEVKTRWKYQGPWLPGMVEADFANYIGSELRNRQPEFLAYVRERIEQTRRTELRQKNRDAGRDVDETIPDMTDAEFRERLLELRASWTLESPLSHMVCDFLDLPAAKDIKLSHLQAYARNMVGPSKTHPSAGLSYLRTGSRVENHPLFGPQMERSPVATRVLRKGGIGSSKIRDRLGVAGIVFSGLPANRFSVPSEFDTPATSELKRKEEQSDTPGYSIKGGAKVWMRPTGATVDEDGRIDLLAEASQAPAVGVKVGQYNIARDSRNVVRPRSTYLGSGNDMSGNMVANLASTLQRNDQRSEQRNRGPGARQR